MSGTLKSLQIIDLTILSLMKMLLQSVSNKTYSASKPEFNNPQNFEEKNLLIFENNLSFEISDFKDQKFKKSFFDF